MTPLFPVGTPPPGEIERNLYRSGLTLLVGIDEAGRGSLCGPVVAAAVALPRALSLPGLHDSKLLSAETREALAGPIRAAAAAWGIGEASAAEIGGINILQATFLAMRRALAPVLETLGRTPDLVLVDGPHPIAGLTLRQKPIVKGDRRSLHIAAASVLAKTHRDALMVRMAITYPGYGFEVHKGYGTARHLAALARLGPCPEHRKSFLR